MLSEKTNKYKNNLFHFSSAAKVVANFGLL